MLFSGKNYNAARTTRPIGLAHFEVKMY